jgi:cytochrome c oxidase cbb3-type subunit IV
MSSLWGHAIGVMIVLLMLTFIGIWVWAWLPFHKKTFDALSRLPLRDDTLGSVREDERS